MRTLKYFLLFVLVYSAGSVQAQYARFVESGVITYQKRVNMYAKIKKRVDDDGSNYMKQYYDQYRKTKPQFNEYEYTMTFGNNTTSFKPQEGKKAAPDAFFGNDPSVDMGNIIFSDLINGQSTSQKNVFEATYLVTDSLRKIDWKITDEFRDIEGFNCRRANAVIMDSVYVVAFYTDQIPVTGGPESFTGLPGMILGIALPHDNVTYFATEIKDQPVSAAQITKPSKGKALDSEGLRKTLQSSLKSWGSYADPYLKAIML